MTGYRRAVKRRPLYGLLRTALVLAVCAVLPAAGLAAQAASRTVALDSSVVRIPMRDGTLLNTRIYRPKERAGPLPFLMLRTPYSIANAGGNFAGALTDLASDGYIFVFQDIRGRFGSDGEFVMLRSPRDKREKGAIDESTDTYDTIEWLLKNVPDNNGRVGMFGVSYPGWLTVMAMLDPHPALKAVSPQASPASMFLGDDFHHNGAFRLSYGFEFVAMMEGSEDMSRFPFDRYDTYSWYLSLGPLSNVDKLYFGGRYPTWNNFVRHPNFDEFWQREALMQYLTRVTVPTLNVAGWWDQEDFYGPITIYETLEKHDDRNLNYLVVGPWNHGAWHGASGQKLGKLDFGDSTAVYFKREIEAPWFAYWLKDKGELKLAEATTFESGGNRWRSHDSWPLREGITQQRFYFQPGGRLDRQLPTVTDSGYDAYISDPANPVPYRARPIRPTWGAGSTWSRWLVDDQRFAQDRPDVLAWETAPLEEDVVIAGRVMANLFASTTGTDADWIVKLIDVYPEQYERDPEMGGYQLMVSNEVFRGRFRNSFEHPEAIPANETVEYPIDLHTQNYRFLKGHRIRVQIQSTWFPLIDRNPQTFMPSIFEAKESDFRIATHRVFRTPSAASYIQLPVMDRNPSA